MFNYYFLKLKNNYPNVNCNTTGCAVGLAILSGEFADEGFTYGTIVVSESTFFI